MVEEELMLEEERDSGLSTGIIVGTAVAAGVLAFLIGRARRSHEPEVRGPRDVAALAFQRAQDANFRGRAASVTKGIFAEKVVPELRPVLLGILKDIQGYTDQAFKRAERAIKDL